MPLLTLISDFGLLNPSDITQESFMLFGLKVLFVTAGVLYLLFALLVVRQISIMSKTITTTASPGVKLLGFIHLAIAASLLIYFFIVL